MDAKYFARQEVPQPKALGGYCSFQTVCATIKKNKTDAEHLEEAIHLSGFSEIKVNRSDILQIDFTM